MIRGAGNVGRLKSEQGDRVRDGRHLLHQEDADLVPAYTAIRTGGGILLSAALWREIQLPSTHLPETA